MKNRTFVIKPTSIELGKLEQKIEIIRSQYYSLDKFYSNKCTLKDSEMFNLINSNLIDLKIYFKECIRLTIELTQILPEEIKLMNISEFHKNLIIAQINIAHTKLNHAYEKWKRLLEKMKSKISIIDFLLSYTFFSESILIFLSMRKNVSISSISINEAMKIIDLEYTLKNKLILNKLKYDELKCGDVILFYDFKKYLKKERIAYYISLVQKSQITHTGIVSHSKNGNVKYISASILGKKVDVFDLDVECGRMLFVMRPKISLEKKRYLLKKLDLLNYKIENANEIIEYSKTKLWIAAFIGFICTFSINHFKKIILINNPFISKKYFCSELIDSIFKDIGIYLTSRSGNSAVVGPAELFTSPHLEFKGIIFNDEDLKDIKTEKIIF